MSFQDIESGRPLPARRDLANGRQDPTQAVASGVFQINTAVSTFQRLVNTLGTPKDTPELREKLHKTRLHIGQLVKDTSAKLKQASETDQHTEVSASKKIADAKLAKDFQAVLKEFQKAQRLAAERETAYAPFVPQAVLPSSYTASELDIRSDKTPEERALLVESRRQEILLLDNEISFNEAIIEERDQGIQEIQQQIGEVNEIFKDLAVLVHEQGTVIGKVIVSYPDISVEWFLWKVCEPVLVEVHPVQHLHRTHSTSRLSEPLIRLAPLPGGAIVQISHDWALS